jgi:hypothetical protein
MALIGQCKPITLWPEKAELEKTSKKEIKKNERGKR